MNHPNPFCLSSNALVEDRQAHHENIMLSAAHIITMLPFRAFHQTLCWCNTLASFVQCSQSQRRNVAHENDMDNHTMIVCFSDNHRMLFDAFCCLDRTKLHFELSTSSSSFKNLKCDSCNSLMSFFNRL